ncbi:MAG: hypothetical protein IPO83_09775 [Chitinophagaceae bacterium]|nr:hypothetical protein [Chitinophagaceae bacterium]
MNDRAIFGKAVRLSLAKAKEKQRDPQANPRLLHLLLPNRTQATHHPSDIRQMKWQIHDNQFLHLKVLI